MNYIWQADSTFSPHFWQADSTFSPHFPFNKEDIAHIGLDNGKTEQTLLIAPDHLPMAGSLYRHEPYGFRTDVSHGPRIRERLALIHNAGSQPVSYTHLTLPTICSV